MKNLVLVFVLLALPSPAVANELDLPPGKWWENQRVVDAVGITSEQQAEISTVVYQRARRMIDLKADVEKAGLDLAASVDAADFDAAAVREAHQGFQSARRSLENERFEMVLEVRQVLSNEQWQKIRELGRRNQQNRGQQRRPGQRPQGGQRPAGGYSR